jgi:hypothetical protein
MLVACSAFVAPGALASGPTVRAGGAPAPAAQTALPDLVVGADRLRSSMIISNRSFTSSSCSFVEGCIAQTGSRRVLQFDMQIINQGNADAQLGRPQDNPNLFEFSPCHGHYHMRDSLDYNMAYTGRDSVGFYDPATGTFFLKNKPGGGGADYTYTFGAGGQALPLGGDWDLDGDATPGLYDPATGAFFLRNSNTPGNADVTFTFGAGNAGYKPIVGDWDGDGRDTVGLYDPATGNFFLRNTNSNGPADLVFSFGAGGALEPIAGDWNGDSTDTIGLYDPATGTFFLKNSNTFGGADLVFGFGGGGLKAITGDFNLTGFDTVGLYDASNGTYFLAAGNAPGPAESVFTFGTGGAGFSSIAADWDFDQEAPQIEGYTGLKQAFCWLDSQRVSGNLPGRYNCSNQGITAGWSDVYGRSLDCQWIDITGLAPGVYQLRVSVNDTHLLVTESNYDNNYAAVKVRITSPTAKYETPEVTVTAPRGPNKFRVGKPITITWEVKNPENITHQEVWLLPFDKKETGEKHGDGDGHDKEDAIARARLIAADLPPTARSFTWTPAADDELPLARFLVRTTDSVHMVGTDGMSAGKYKIKSAKK